MISKSIQVDIRNILYFNWKEINFVFIVFVSRSFVLEEGATLIEQNNLSN
jgi:hypothetical protein